MKKFFICISLVVTGLMASCVDKYEEVDADSKPSWLGGSIYSELKNPNQERLTGSFETYLRLIKDLGEEETLSRTGSKTVFPANDEAFERFFKSNDWNVSSYEQLSLAQKKMLLYSSMLDNALLLGMLPNQYNGTAEPNKGQAVKHQTNVGQFDTLQHVSSWTEMPQGNDYWKPYYEKGIDLVSDGTTPMMVHLTREYMLNKDITVLGENSDFAILTGSPYTEGSAYIFNNRVIHADVTCQNGYIHQLDNVLVPPGNMGEVLRRHNKTKYFSRILDHYAMPYFDQGVTTAYNNWAKENGEAQKDSIFRLRYLSYLSDGGENVKDPKGADQTKLGPLNYDPGWNQYFPGSSDGEIDASVEDMGAFFVPDDEAVKTYFLPGGAGAHLIDIHGSKRLGSVINDEAHLMENLDSLHAHEPGIMSSFIKNLLKARFSNTVPSKFPNVVNDASENMGLTLDILDKKADGKYDITIANNGVVYLINQMIVPDEHNSVLAPAAQYNDMKVMNWCVQEPQKNYALSIDFKYYLMAMSANYAFFVPEDAAFDFYYLDPASLGHVGPGNKPRPDVLHLYYDKSSENKGSQLKCIRYYYDPATGEVDTSTPRPVDNPQAIKTQLLDIMNYHTVVLPDGETLGNNHYYKTKHGGEIYVENGTVGAEVKSGAQIDNPAFFPAPRIKTVYNEKNGHAYRMDRVIQAPQKSVYAILTENADKFSEFKDLCTGFEATDVMAWAGISADYDDVTGTSEQDTYTIFTNMWKTGKDEKTGLPTFTNAAIDKNVRFFNTYNYTLFAPDNAAMAIAYANGLPTWQQINDMYVAFNAKVQEYNDTKDAGDPDYEPDATDLANMEKAKTMMTQIRNFIRYHFVTKSVYVDNSFDTGDYLSFSPDEYGMAKVVKVEGKNGKMTISDCAGHTIQITTNSGKMVNQMARDYWMGNSDGSSVNDVKSASSIYTSSFCAIHQISEPLCGNKSGKFNE